MKPTNKNHLIAEISKNKSIAYKVIGKGPTLFLLNRFRGDLDSWDPLFLDELSRHNQVIYFDYAGKAASSGEEAKSQLDMCRDMIDLADFLQIEHFSILGWSLGGFVGQIALTEFPERIEKSILIGTRVPGEIASPISPVFFQLALKEENSLSDETILFFNPKSKHSKNAALHSHNRIKAMRSKKTISMQKAQWENMLQHTDLQADRYNTLEKMKKTEIPILVISGEHDICFPAKDWKHLIPELASSQLIVFPDAGHAPHHQFPQLIGKYINSFLQEI